MAKSKLGRNPFQLNTTPVERNPLFAAPAVKEEPREEAQLGLFAGAPTETLGEDAPIGSDEERVSLLAAPVGLVAHGLLKGYAFVRGLIATR